jgi:hypothetical protein
LEKNEIATWRGLGLGASTIANKLQLYIGSSMTIDPSPKLCAPDAEWTQLTMEGKGMLFVCPVVDDAPVGSGEALLPDDDEPEGFERTQLATVLSDWVASAPDQAIYVLVHPSDFAFLARRRH